MNLPRSSRKIAIRTRGEVAGPRRLPILDRAFTSPSPSKIRVKRGAFPRMNPNRSVVKRSTAAQSRLQSRSSLVGHLRRAELRSAE